MLELFLASILAFIITHLSMPSIIKVAVSKGLLDMPDHRKAHETPTPAIGGIGIFLGFFVVLLLLAPDQSIAELKYILLALILIFALGIRDDLYPLTPLAKLGGQLVAVTILIFFADLKFSGLYGIFGIYNLPYFVSIILSYILYIFLINSFNLIDGIDGLCSSTVIFILSICGAWLLFSGQGLYALLAFAVIGSTLSFLRFNVSPAKIFMGDAGSLVLGTVCTICAIKVLESAASLESFQLYQKAPAIMLSLLILPVFDTVRVFIIRIIKGNNPFLPDKNHIHHLLLQFGFSHMQVTSILVSINISFLVVVIGFNSFNLNLLIVLILSLAFIFSQVLSLSIYLKSRKAYRS